MHAQAAPAYVRSRTRVRVGAHTYHPQKPLRPLRPHYLTPNNNNNLLKYNNNNTVTPTVTFLLRRVTTKNNKINMFALSNLKTTPNCQRKVNKIARPARPSSPPQPNWPPILLPEPVTATLPPPPVGVTGGRHSRFQPRDGPYFIRTTPTPRTGRALRGVGGSKIQPTPPLAPGHAKPAPLPFGHAPSLYVSHPSPYDTITTRHTPTHPLPTHTRRAAAAFNPFHRLKTKAKPLTMLHCDAHATSPKHNRQPFCRVKGLPSSGTARNRRFSAALASLTQPP